jgi:hypothetical protein
MKKIVFLFLFASFALRLFSQDTKNVFKNGYGITIGGYATINGGYGLSAAFGFWKSFRQVQYSTNIAVKGSFGQQNLGCRDKAKTRSMFNVLFSPMVTVDPFNTHRARYESVNPFYYGFASGVFNNYKDAFTAGTTFVACPRGIGINILSARNRAQQLMYLQIKSGLGKSKSIDGALQAWYGPTLLFNFYEDFLGTDNGALQWWADNRDRFFTGGGNIQLRVNDFVLLKAYWDVYTGNSYSPDATHYRDVDVFEKQKKKIKKKVIKNYAYQEPDQNRYNKARFFGVVEIQNLNNREMDLPLPNIELIGGATNGRFCMGIQNAIHSLSKEKYLNSSTGGIRRKHFFEPYPQSTSPFLGIGSNYSFY